MTTATSDEVPRRSWPLKFFERRQYFDRKAENQPYIEWLREPPFNDGSGEEWKENEEDDDDEDEDDEDEDDQDEDDDEEDGGASVCISRLCPLI